MLEKFKQRRNEGTVVSMLIKQGKYVNGLANYMMDIPYVEQIHKNEISSLIDTCRLYKHIIFNVLCIKGEYYNGRVDDNLIKELEKLDINSLEDCESASKYIYEIGNSLRANMNFLFAPFISRPFYMSFLDFFIVSSIPLALYILVGIFL